MTKTFCDVCGKEMNARTMCMSWSIMTKKREGFVDKVYSCVCNGCYNKIMAFISDLQNSSNEGETNG